MRRLLPLAVVVVALLAACKGTDRPEGVVEQWLISLNQGKAGEPHKYAEARLSNEILPNWQTCDPGSLDVIEVGIHRDVGPGGTDVALVPYRLKYVSDLSSCRSAVRPSAPRDGIAELRLDAGGWRIASIESRSADALLRVPSEGGQRIGGASAAAWGLAVGISAALMLLVALVMRLTPKPVALPTRRRE